MKVALFDWDGVLVNISVWKKTVEDAFRYFGKRPPTMAECVRRLADGNYFNIYKLSGITASTREMNAIFDLSYLSQIQKAEFSPYVCKGLTILAEHGTILGLVTAERIAACSSLLQKSDIKHLFHHLKFDAFDKKEAIREILRKKGLNPKECCFVDDMPSGIRQGKEAGVVTIAFRNRYVRKKLILATRPNFIAKNFKEVVSIILNKRV